MTMFRIIHTRFWNDPKVVEEMTPEDRYLFLYLLTNDKTTQIGIYQIMIKQMAFDTGYSLETISSIFRRLQDEHKLVKYNSETRELAIKNWGQYNLTRGGKPMEDCVKSELTRVKDRSLIQYVGESVKHQGIRELFLSAAPESDIAPNFSELYSKAMQFYQQNFGILSAYIGEEIIDSIDEFGEELVIEAMKISLSIGIRNWRYTYGILKRWRDQNVKTLNDVLALEQEFQQRKASPTQAASNHLKVYVHNPSAGEDEE